MRSLKPILAAAAVTFLVAACGGNDSPAGNGSSADASDSASDSTDPSAEADAPLPADNLVGQPAPSVGADDDHPQTQWKSQMFASANAAN
jgi:hypothetical protein